MKLWESEYSLRDRLVLLRLNAWNTMRTETAYVGQNWGHLASTVLFTVTALFFVDVLFGNIRTLAGYTKDEMLVYFLVNQLNFYLTYTWSLNNVEALIQDVNRGNLDLLLTKPLPSLLYVSTRSIALLSRFRDAIPPVVIQVAVVNWSTLTILPIQAGAAILIFILGQLAMNAVTQLLTFPAFWFGEAIHGLHIANVPYDQLLPLEGLGKSLRVLLTTVFPALVTTALAVSVLLGKADVTASVVLALVVTAVFWILRTIVWNLALRHYSSASS